MAVSTQRVALDVSKKPTPQQVVRLGQGDASGTKLIADIYDGGTAYSLTNYSVRLKLRLPSSSAYYSVSGTCSGNTATFNINERYAASSFGNDGFGYVEILSGSTVICSTSRFKLIVLRDAADGAELSEQYINEVEEAVNRANEAAEAAEGVVLQAVPTMTANVKGGAKLGSGLAVANDTLSVNASTVASGTLPIARGGTGAATAQAARESLNVVGCGDQANMNAAINPLTGSTQIWGVWATCTNETNTTYNGSRVGMLLYNDGITMYSGSTQWKLDAATTSTSSTSGTLTAASGITITLVNYAERNGVAQLTIGAKGFSATTGIQTVGTIAAGKRPISNAYGVVTSANAVYGVANTAGEVNIYFNAAPSTTTSYYMSFTYMLA